MRRTMGGIAAVVATSLALVACSDTVAPSSRMLRPDGPAFAPAPKVTICHAAGQLGTTKYIEITMSANGLNGHFNNNGTPKAGHEDDYIVAGPGLCATAQVKVCKVLGRGTDDGRTFDFTLSTGQAFKLKIGECSSAFDVVPGNLSATEKGEIPGTGTFFATALTTIPATALQSSTGVVALRTDLPPGVATDIVGVAVMTAGVVTTITFANSN